MAPPNPSRRIAVDLTPLLPGGENGGAGLVATSLVRDLAGLAADVEFVLLTSWASHDEVAWLDAPNVHRRCVVRGPDIMRRGDAARAQVRTLVRVSLDRLLPSGARVGVKNRLWALARARQRARVASGLKTDLTFCPFTAPHFFVAGVPLVSIVYDFQHLDYPEFFSADQRRYRRQHIVDACNRAMRVVCISDNVRHALLTHLPVPTSKVVTIHLALLQNTQSLGAPEREQLLTRLGVQPGRFLLYPANFWVHKNHLRLIEATRQHRAKHPESDLVVVCTGAPNQYMRDLVAKAQTRAPGAFVFPGYLSEIELATLFRACSAVIFPSLYEGFGMPVLEAMTLGKPVLCSNVTSLPEVVGDAAQLFDPTSVDQIAAAIELVETRPELVAELARRGLLRAATFGTSKDMAMKYLQVFDDVINGSTA